MHHKFKVCIKEVIKSVLFYFLAVSSEALEPVPDEGFHLLYRNHSGLSGRPGQVWLLAQFSASFV